MALEALCGVPRRNIRSEDRLFGEDQGMRTNGDEFMDAFPNANDPMAIIAPPFVSKSVKIVTNSLNNSRAILFSASIRTR